MGSMALDGLGGYSFQSIIDQMMQLERQSGNVLTTKKANYNAQVTALQSMNAKVSSITTNALAILGKTSMKDLNPKPDEVWAAAKGTSSNADLVSVKTKDGAQAGNLDLRVDNVATSQQVLLSGDTMTALSAKINAGSSTGDDKPPQSISIVVGNKITTVKPTSGSAQDIARAINAAKESGVSATAIRRTDGTYMLQITGTETGNDGKFQLYVGDLNVQMAGREGAERTETKTGTGYSTVTYKNAKFVKDADGKDTTQEDLSFENALAAAKNDLKAKTEALENFPTGGSYEVFGASDIVRQAVDAQVTLYAGTDKETQISSSSNTFSALMDKVDITINADKYVTDSNGKLLDEDGVEISQAKRKAQVSVTEDSTPASDAVRKLTQSINQVIDEIASQTKTSTASRTDGSGTYTKLGTLTTDSNTRAVSQALRSIMGGGITVGEGANARTYSMKDLGIEVKRTDGTLKMNFDATAFAEAMKEDPNKVRQMATALAEKVAKVTDGFSNKVDGTITNAITSKQSTVKRLDDQISAFNLRMDTKEKNMKLQFATLQTNLQKMSSQSSWLASQLAGLSS